MTQFAKRGSEDFNTTVGSLTPLKLHGFGPEVALPMVY
jgi:hypothetical protein